MAQRGDPATEDILTRLRPRGVMNRREALALLTVVVLMGLVGWMYLSQASEAAELRHYIRELRQQKGELQRQNDQRTYEIARLAAVDQLEKRARELGYVAVWQARFVSVAGFPSQDEASSASSASPTPLASSEEITTLAQREPVEQVTPSAMAGWWQAVTEQFETWAQTGQP